MSIAWLAALGNAVPQGCVWTVFLLSLRLGALLLLTPVLYAAGMPASIRVLLVVAFAFALAVGAPGGYSQPMPALDAGRIVLAALAEAALGATLALGIHAAFAAISLAGRLIDVQIGFGMAQVLDPLTRRQVTVLHGAFDRLAVLVFFLADAHHALLRAVAFTIDRFPPGAPWPLHAAAPMVMQQMAAIFTLGFALAAPVVTCVVLVDFAMGAIARNLPQVNMFVIGMPVKVLVGLAMLAVAFAGMGDAMSRIHAAMFRSWQAGFAAMAPQGVR